MSLFYNFRRSEGIRTIRMKWPSDNYVIPAGTPMSESGIANDGNAIGVLTRAAVVPFNYPLSVAPYVGKQEPKGNLDYDFDIIVSGFVDLNRAEASFGEKYSDEAKNAMSRINFVDSKEPQSFGGGSGGASSWNDLTDKPFYEEEGGLTELLPETTPEYDESGGQFFIMAAPELVDGETYMVNWNGTEYQTKCVDITDILGISCFVLGDLGTLSGGEVGEVTGEPFVIEVVPTEGVTVAMPLDGSTTLTISIVGSGGTVIHKLDNKYLDLAWLPTMKNVLSEVFPETSGTKSATINAIEISEPLHLEAGKTYTVTWNGVDYECEAFAVAFNGYNLTGLGDLSSSFSDAPASEAPFGFLEYPEEIAVQVGDMYVNILVPGYESEAYDYTFSIKTVVQVPNKIPEEFLPETTENDLDELPELTGTSLGGDAAALLAIKNEYAAKGVAGCQYDGETYAVLGIKYDGECGNLLLARVKGFLGNQPKFGLYVLRYISASAAAVLMPYLTDDALYLDSSTSGSTKRFQITVDDSGTLTAIEET